MVESLVAPSCVLWVAANDFWCAERTRRNWCRVFSPSCGADFALQHKGQHPTTTVTRSHDEIVSKVQHPFVGTNASSIDNKHRVLYSTDYSNQLSGPRPHVASRRISIFLVNEASFEDLRIVSTHISLCVTCLTMGSISGSLSYSPVREAERIFQLLCDQTEQLGLPSGFEEIKKNVVFKSDFDRVYFPIPFKETETASALKGIEGGVASALAGLKTGQQSEEIKVDLEKVTSFLFQSYLATVGGLGKLDDGVKAKLKGQPYSSALLQGVLTLRGWRYRFVASTV
jgi:hypothetical protein